MCSPWFDHDWHFYIVFMIMITKISMLSVSSFLPHDHDQHFCIDFKIVIGSHFGLTMMMENFHLKLQSWSCDVATFLPLSLYVTMNPPIMITFSSHILWSWSHFNISSFFFLKPFIFFSLAFILFILSLKDWTPALHILSLYLPPSSNLSLKSSNYFIEISLNLLPLRIHYI